MTRTAVQSPNQFDRVLEFLAELDRREIPSSLEWSRDDALMVIVATPGRRWEIEFMRDGEIEVEQFTSDGEIGGEERLEELWKLWEG